MPPEKQPRKAIEGKPLEHSARGGSVVSVEHYEGVIPHPKLMKEWEELVPGSARSIFSRFENQSDHRIEIENKVVRANNFKLYVGPIFAFVIAMTAIAGGIWIALTSQPLVGGFLSLSGLATVIAPFLANEIKNSKKE